MEKFFYFFKEKLSLEDEQLYILRNIILNDNVTFIKEHFNTFYEMIIIDKPMLNTSSYLQPINYLPLLISFLVLGSIILNILLIFNNLKNNPAIVIFVIVLFLFCFFDMITSLTYYNYLV